MNRLLTTLTILFAISNVAINGQSVEGHDSHRIVFYNLENFFDIHFDSSKTYNQFTPNGDYHWTKTKYNLKKKHIYKVLQNIGQDKGISIAGVCELENKDVLKDLLYFTPLKLQHFNIEHFESNDPRGIDVALFYNPHFYPFHSELINVKNINGNILKSRGILYVKGNLDDIELHIFVNHWTSRYRGLAESEPLRLLYAKSLLSKVDSILQLNKNSNVIVIGDFNDNPNDLSMKELTPWLFNMTPVSYYHNADGSVKFKEYWYKFDQILISKAIKEGTNGLKVDNSAFIYDPEWLLEDDAKYMGNKPFRTNIGFSFNGGFSDHLPIFIDLINVNE